MRAARSHAAGAAVLLAAAAVSGDATSPPVASVHADAVPDELMTIVERDAKQLIAALGTGLSSGGAVSRAVWIPRHQWELPQLALEGVVSRLYRLARPQLPEGGRKIAGAALRSRWLPVRWRPPHIPPDEGSLRTDDAPATGDAAFPVRRSLLHFGGCSTVSMVTDAKLEDDGTLAQTPQRGAVVWPARSRYVHWPGRSASWNLADIRLQAFDGCVGKAQLRGEHVVLQVDWWERPVGNRTLNRLWAQEKELSQMPSEGAKGDDAPEGELAVRTVDKTTAAAAALTLPVSAAADEDESAFVHVLVPPTPRNITLNGDRQGLLIEWGEGGVWMGVPIIAQASDTFVASLSAPGSRTFIAFVEAGSIASYAKEIARLRAQWPPQSRGRALVADAARAHRLLPFFGLTRSDVPAAVTCVAGRYDPDTDVAKELSGPDDGRLAGVVQRVLADGAVRRQQIDREHAPERNALSHSVWMRESRWLIKKADMDRLCRIPAAERAAHTRNGHPTMCLFLFDRQREDEPGHDTHDKILDQALKSASVKQPEWLAAWEPIFVPTGVGSGGFGWPSGARDAAIRLGMGHRSPPFIAAWEPEWEKDGRWASVYPPSPGYERKDWKAEDVAQWLAELDTVAGRNPPHWLWALITHPGFIVVACVLVCVVWAGVSLYLRSQYEDKRKKRQ